VTIERHVKIRQDVNPYEVQWEAYLEARQLRRMQQTLAGRGTIKYLWKEQGGRCVACGEPLPVTKADGDYHLHHRLWRCHGGTDTVDNLELLHANCHRQIHAQASVDGNGRVSREAFVKA
jgi:RNA-directed DNA polymerase